MPRAQPQKPVHWMGNHLYWIRDPAAPENKLIIPKDFRMTYLEVVFNCGGLPGENELRAVDAMREVYGIQRVVFNGKQRTVTVQFDASRLKQDSVAKMLRQAGIDVREPVALA
jgi:hypothetical protein